MPEPLELPPVVPEPLEPEPLELPPVEPEPLEPGPLELPPVVPEPLEPAPLELPPVAPEPLELPPVVPPIPAAFKAAVAAAVRTVNSVLAFNSPLEALIARATALRAAAAVDLTTFFVVDDIGCNFATSAAARACAAAVFAEVAAALAAFHRVCANC